METKPSQRERLLRYAAENYGTTPEYPWDGTPDAAVLRHPGNQKWYGLLMRIPSEKLGLAPDGTADILNVKCSPLETGSLRQKPGIFPAYHMNKTHWITILLDGTLPEPELFWLLDESYTLTMPNHGNERGTSMKIWNATIHTMTDAGILENGYVCIENGKITEVGTGTPSVLAPEDIDAGGSVLLPGFIDAHTHLGIIENGIAFEGDDCNEATDPFTPHLRVIDGVNPLDHCFAEARAAGVTTVMTSPGSANACGGTMAILKTAGRMADRMQIGTGVKFALGENPKSVYNDRDETPITRMATAAMIREGLAKAQRYQQELDFAESDPDEHMPDYDAKSEALLPLLERDVKAHFHCHRADDICTAIRIAREFNLDYVIIHGTEGHLIADILAEENAKVIAGPILCDRCKPEMQNLTISGPSVMQKAGVKLALCTDHPVIPIQYLPTTAALAVKGGMKREDALYAITAGAAEILGVENRVGSIAPGMDADIQLYHGDPLDLLCDPWMVLIDGKNVL